jgi:hypothetical protein
MTDAIIRGVGPSGTSSVWDAVPYVYLLRIQLFTVILLLSFPFIALRIAPNLLKGIFDVIPRGMIFVALAAILASWTTTVTAWQVLHYGPERFHIRPFPLGRSFFTESPRGWGRYLVIISLSLPTILVAAVVSNRDGTSTYLALALSVVGGGILAAIILVIGEQFKRRGWSRFQPVGAFLSFFGPGFRKNEGGVHDGHYVALWSFLLCLLVYVAIGIGTFFQIGYPAIVPTLADLLVFLMILCWGLSAATFILDYYRIPLLVPFLLIAALSSHFHATDHYFYMFPARNSVSLTPAQVIRAGKPGTKVIVVAASGGGIKAAAWTTRVLTGLEESNPHAFGDSVRLVSAVSGGSVGAMYFVSEYDEDGKGLPSDKTTLEKAIAQSEASSLDDIAWGLVYPDFFRIFLPVFKHLDRGRALEAALTRELPTLKHHLWSPLSDWREGVLEGRRPAVVFNATITESGERILLGTTDLPHADGRTSLRDNEFPRFADLDISLVTAARLSASFPYVSPAARPDISGPQIHVVDGGYTDNYGMATLLAWLDAGLWCPGKPVTSVLVIEIRASPPASEPPPLSWQGWPFQSYAPISTMLDVRDIAQISRNEEQLDLLRRYASSRNVDIEDVVFEYPPENAPLSWHLSPRDKKEIQTIWCSEATKKPKETVRIFLNASGPQSVPTTAGCG